MTDVRAWLTEHCPDAFPWQLDCAEALIAGRQEGRPAVFQPMRRYGQTRLRAMVDEWITATEAHSGGSNP